MKGLKRAFDKKKAFRLFIKQQVRAGKVNDANGTWGPGIDNAMKACLKAGHR